MRTVSPRPGRRAANVRTSQRTGSGDSAELDFVRTLDHHAGDHVEGAPPGPLTLTYRAGLTRIRTSYWVEQEHEALLRWLVDAVSTTKRQG